MNPLYAMLPDEMLIRRVLSGKRQMFEVLVHRYFPGVYAVAYAQTRNHADAEDIAQEAFLKAFIALDTLRNRQRFEGWVVTIARNMANKLWQKRNREERIAEQLADMPEPEKEDAARHELQALLRQRIEQLSAEQREILLLHYFGGKSTREMAVLLDISRDAVKKRLQRARETLSKDLLDVLGDACAPQRPLTEQKKVIMIAIAAALPSWEQCAAATLVQRGLTSSIWTMVISPATPLIVSVCVGAVILAAVLVENSGEKLSPASENLSSSAKKEKHASVDEKLENADEVDDAVQPQTDEGSRIVSNTKLDHADTQNNKKKTLSSDIESQLLQSVSIEFEDIYIAEIADFISDLWDINVIVDHRVLAVPTGSDRKRWSRLCYTPLIDTTVATCNLPETRLGDVLTTLCDPFGLEYVVIPGYLDYADYIWISTPEEIANNPFPVASERYDGRDPEAMLDTLVPPLEFHDIVLFEILDFIVDTLDFNIIADERYVGNSCSQPEAIVDVPMDEIQRQTETLSTGGIHNLNRVITTGKIRYLSVKDISLRDAVECLLRPLGLTYSIEDGFVWITSSELQQQESFRPMPHPFAEQLSKPYQGLFPYDNMDGNPSFSALLAVLEMASKVPFHVDKRVINAESPRLYDLTYHHTLPACALLNVTTRLCDLGYVALPDHIIVSTPDRLLRSDFPEEYFVPVSTLFPEEGSLQQAFQENNPPESGGVKQPTAGSY